MTIVLKNYIFLVISYPFVCIIFYMALIHLSDHCVQWQVDSLSSLLCISPLSDAKLSHLFVCRFPVCTLMPTQIKNCNKFMTVCLFFGASIVYTALHLVHCRTDYNVLFVDLFWYKVLVLSDKLNVCIVTYFVYILIHFMFIVPTHESFLFISIYIYKAHKYTNNSYIKSLVTLVYTRFTRWKKNG